MRNCSIPRPNVVQTAVGAGWPEVGGDDDDLDSLLSSFGDSDDTPEEESSGDDDMDPELAALLAGL